MSAGVIRWNPAVCQKTYDELAQLWNTLVSDSTTLGSPPGGARLLAEIGVSALYTSAHSALNATVKGLGDFLDMQSRYLAAITAPFAPITVDPLFWSERVNYTIPPPMIGMPPLPPPPTGTFKALYGWGDSLLDFSQTVTDPAIITFGAKYGGGSKGWFDKTPILPKYTPGPYVAPRGPDGRFLPRPRMFGNMKVNDADYGPTAPGWYARYTGTDFGGPKFYSRDANGKLVEVDPGRARGPDGRFLPKVQPDKLRPTFFEASISQETLKGVKGSQQFNDWLGGSYKAGAWGSYNASASITKDGAEVKAGVGVGVGAEGKLTASGQWNAGPAQVNATGNATVFVGARANGELKAGIGKDEYGRYQAYAGGSASAFAGVEAKVDGKVDGSIGGYHVGSVGGSAGVTAGVGAEVKGDVGYRDGKFRVAGGFKFAVGVGLSANVDLTVDVAGIANGLKDGASKAWGGVKSFFGF